MLLLCVLFSNKRRHTRCALVTEFRRVLFRSIVFRPETLRAAAARAEDEYAGFRIDFVAELAGARLPMHVDIGYGDAITPGAIEIEYPSLLGPHTAHLLAYPPETGVDEKILGLQLGRAAFRERVCQAV